MLHALDASSSGMRYMSSLSTASLPIVSSRLSSKLSMAEDDLWAQSMPARRLQARWRQRKRYIAAFYTSHYCAHCIWTGLLSRPLDASSTNTVFLNNKTRFDGSSGLDIYRVAHHVLMADRIFALADNQVFTGMANQIFRSWHLASAPFLAKRNAASFLLCISAPSSSTSAKYVQAWVPERAVGPCPTKQNQLRHTLICVQKYDIIMISQHN